MLFRILANCKLFVHFILAEYKESIFAAFRHGSVIKLSTTLVQNREI